jgi:hypothetical protein
MLTYADVCDVCRYYVLSILEFIERRSEDEKRGLT